MHIEKNVFDNFLNTIMDLKSKTKDNTNVRMDLKEYCRRKELELIDHGGVSIGNLRPNTRSQGNKN